MAKKKYRELTVGEYGGYGRRVSPMIRLNGLWLEEAGFHAGDPVLVRCEDGKLIITQDRARAEMLEAEKAFMEEETKKLRKMFLSGLWRSGRPGMVQLRKPERKCERYGKDYYGRCNERRYRQNCDGF